MDRANVEACGGSGVRATKRANEASAVDCTPEPQTKRVCNDGSGWRGRNDPPGTEKAEDARHAECSNFGWHRPEDASGQNEAEATVYVKSVRHRRSIKLTVTLCHPRPLPRLHTHFAAYVARRLSYTSFLATGRAAFRNCIAELGAPW